MFDIEAIAVAMSGLVGGPWWSGTHKVMAVPVLDSGGSIVTPGAVTSTACVVQIDAVTQDMRAEVDFQESDVRLLIVGVDALKIDDRISVDAGPHAGTSYALRSATRDPGALGWDCRAREV